MRARVVPPPAIPLAFVASALLALGAALGWAAIATPPPLALLHLIVVGGFLTVAMGLLYQFVPVVATAPLRWPALAFVHLALALTGTLCIVTGFATGDLARVHLGGLFHLGGIALEIVLLVATVRARSAPAPAAGGLLALVWLVGVVIAGAWLAGRLAHGVPTGNLARMHAVAGIAGFFGTLIVAVTLRLARMFERVDFEPRTAWLALAATGAAALALAVPRAGGVALVAVAALFGYTLAAVARRRNPAYQPETLWYAGVSAAGALAAAAAYALGHGALAVGLAVWFFIGAAVLGYLQRIVPFIWWIVRSRREGTPNIPTLARMNAPTLGAAILVAWVLAGIVRVVAPISHLWAAVALLAWLGLLLQLARPFVVRRVAGS